MKGKIFNAQEVQAIIVGNKTMFREVIKVQPTNENQVFSTVASSIRNKDIGTHNFINPKAIWEQTKKFKCPYQVGQKIFCKEVFCKSIFGKAIYKDEEKEIRGFGGKEVVVKWKPAQHMKQEQSRLTLEITNIKVERLAEISEGDCKKEGIGYTGGWNGEDYDDGEFYFGKLTESEDGMNWKNEMFEYPNLAFASIWNKTHKKPKEKFETNPFVWVVDFKINK